VVTGASAGALSLATYSPDREACRRAIERRFGWLKLELALVGGSVSSLKPHQQVLWYGREKVVGRFNRIGDLPGFAKRAAAYRKLTRELERR
jgi:hypothetical protein